MADLANTNRVLQVTKPIIRLPNYAKHHRHFGVMCVICAGTVSTIKQTHNVIYCKETNSDTNRASSTRHVLLLIRVLGIH